MPYPRKKSRSAIWRGLEVALRLRVWDRIFYGLLEDPGIHDGTRLLLLATLPEHAHYLRNFHGGGNWATMELTSLALIAVTWPEFKNAPAWLDYAEGGIDRRARKAGLSRRRPGRDDGPLSPGDDS